MTTKQILTNKFSDQKKNFQIDDDLDLYIKSFVIDLNKHEHIVTIWSCEGADNTLELGESYSHSVSAYFGMNVSEQYWDYFWTNVVPDLISEEDIILSTNKPMECFFFHAISLHKKYDFWRTIFKVFKKHGIIKNKIKIWK